MPINSLQYFLHAEDMRLKSYPLRFVITRSSTVKEQQQQNRTISCPQLALCRSDRSLAYSSARADIEKSCQRSYSVRTLSMVTMTWDINIAFIPFELIWDILNRLWWNQILAWLTDCLQRRNNEFACAKYVIRIASKNGCLSFYIPHSRGCWVDS